MNMPLGGNQRLGDEDEIHQEPSGNGKNHTDVTLYSSSSSRRHMEMELELASSPSSSFSPARYNWQSSSPSSTEQMLGAGAGAKASFRSAASQGSSSSSRPRFAAARRVPPLVREIEWGALWGRCKEWIKNPMNMALFAWVAAVAVSGAILFMVMTGMLNRALPSKAARDAWFEANNQILNALFTLMCLYQHPRRFHHLALLCRWRAGDMLRLRQAYCKDGACKPGERRHMAVVVLLLHLNCFAQYALCGLNLGYPRRSRPVVGVALTVSVAICAPAVAGLYNNLSPLGKEYEAQAADEESQSKSQGSSNPQLQRKSETAVSEEPGRRRAEWEGGLLDLWDDISLAYLSLFCSCCVFGWNMARLGMGNMYVHVVTFLLFCLAPFFIFNLAAVNIDDEAVRDALGLGGVLLCALGLLYGGFWRIQMRRRLDLPGNDACCGKPDVTDCFQWLCCYSCSLAQEVRTADAYQVVQLQVQDTSYHHGNGNGNVNAQEDLQQQHMVMDMDDPSMKQPLRFAGVFAPRDTSTTVPPAVSVIHKH